MIARLEDFKGVCRRRADAGFSGKYAYDAYNVSTERGGARVGGGL